jgi:quercetin dioxygenase-like cupin family protein
MSGARASGRLIRFAGDGWEGVTPEVYKDAGEGWLTVTRHRLLGSAEGLPFRLRYFEIAPGGYTTFERHEHQHAVIAIRGEGTVRLGDRWESVRFGDVVYVAPNEPHQFRAAGDEPFGFVCVVDAERDRPVSL